MYCLNPESEAGPCICPQAHNFPGAGPEERCFVTKRVKKNKEKKVPTKKKFPEATLPIQRKMQFFAKAIYQDGNEAFSKIFTCSLSTIITACYIRNHLRPFK